MEKTTIVNSVTPLIVSGTSIIRISGPISFYVIDEIFYPINPVRYKKKETYTAHYGDIKFDDQLIDEVIVLFMRKPRSFTGEDIVEIQTHGNPFIVKIIIEELLKRGCKLSERGEFSKRAFLNGRLDLSQSEAIIDLVEANNKSSLKMALLQLKGELSLEIKELSKTILDTLSFLEASLEFSTKDTNIKNEEKILFKKINFIIKKIKLLLSTYNDGKIYKEGIKIILIGSPNVGKSTIFNLFLKEERAIVTNIPGTTRDILEGKVILENIVFNFIDTAGVHNSKDIIEKIGISKTYKELQNSQIIIFVTDNNNIKKEEKILLKKIKKTNKAYIIVENKIDLNKNKKLFKNFENSILFSAKKKIGINKLKNKIKKILKIKKIENKVFLNNLRYYEILKRSLEFFENALKGIENKIPYDLISIDFRAAYDLIGQITGETVEENLLDKIFSKFCIGK